MQAGIKTCRPHLERCPSGADDGAGKLRDRLVAVSARAWLIAFEMESSFSCGTRRSCLSNRLPRRRAAASTRPVTKSLFASEAGWRAICSPIEQGDLTDRSYWSGLRKARSRRSAFRQPWVSWSGSMFEYLHCRPGHEGAARQHILDQTSRQVIRKQMSYASDQRGFRGASRRLPTIARGPGDDVSVHEFRLCRPSGLKRGLAQDTPVIGTLCSSACPPSFQPDMAVRNLERLKKLGALGR